MSPTARLAVLVAAWIAYGTSVGDPGPPVVALLLVSGGRVSTALRRAPDAASAPSSVAKVLVWGGCLVAGFTWQTDPGPFGIGYTWSIAAGIVLATAILHVLEHASGPVPRSRGAAGPMLLAAWAIVVLSSTGSSTPVAAALLALFWLVNVAALLSTWWGRAAVGPRGARAIGAAALFPIGWLVAAALATQATSSGYRGFHARLSAPTKSLAEAAPEQVGSPTVALSGKGPEESGFEPVLEVGRQGEEALYLRTQVYERYKGGAWFSARSARQVRVPRSVGRMPQARRMLLLEPLGDVLPAPADVAAISCAALKDERGLLRSGGGTEVAMFDLATAPGSGSEPPAPAELPGLTAVPEKVRLTLEPLARELTKGIADPERKDAAAADAIEAYFHASYRYSLDTALPKGEEGLLLFVNERRPAYCVYFASASTLMLRTLGIPARMVGGFLAHEIDPGARGRFVVRLRDAHAWTEAWIDGAWRRVDATPTEEAMLAQGPPPGLRGLADRLRRARRRWSEEPPTVRELLPAVPVLTLLLAFLSRRVLLRWWRKRRAGTLPPPAPAAAPHPLTSLHARFEAIVQEAVAAPWRPSQTDDELLARLAEERAIPAGFQRVAAAFVEGYRPARFGGADAGVELASRLAELEALLPLAAGAATPPDLGPPRGG